MSDTFGLLYCYGSAMLNGVLSGMKDNLWLRVVSLIEQQKDKESLWGVLKLLLTQEEQQAIGSRLAIMKALLDGQESQRVISVEFGVSIAKVTRCSHYLKTLVSSNMK